MFLLRLLLTASVGALCVYTAQVHEEWLDERPNATLAFLVTSVVAMFVCPDVVVWH